MSMKAFSSKLSGKGIHPKMLHYSAYKYSTYMSNSMYDVFCSLQAAATQ